VTDHDVSRSPLLTSCPKTPQVGLTALYSETPMAKDHMPKANTLSSVIGSPYYSPVQFQTDGSLHHPDEALDITQYPNALCGAVSEAQTHTGVN
jgi:hypothetical protein